MLVETFAVLSAVSAAAAVLHATGWGGTSVGASWARAVAGFAVLTAQALWFERLYLVGHEAAHRKLAPGRPWLNDLIGQVVLLPIGFPVVVYRAVHTFHHAHNRRTERHSALDVFVVRGPLTRWAVLRCRLLWYLGAFAGGLLLHSVASVVVFLCVPTHRARRISPAFQSWTPRQRATAWVQLAACAGLHLGVLAGCGVQVYLWVLGYPFLAFAWLWSALLYVFHYGTTTGPRTRFHVRRVDAGRVTAWLTLNFTEHVTHHVDPRLPWYRLPEQPRTLPEPYRELNREAPSIWRAALDQWAGPTIVSSDQPLPSRLFQRWED